MGHNGGRKTKPEPGETCVRGHDNWVQYAGKTWFCRDCRNENNRNYRKHVKLTNPKLYKAQQRKQKARYYKRNPEAYERHKARERARRKAEREAKKAQEKEQGDEKRAG